MYESHSTGDFLPRASVLHLQTDQSPRFLLWSLNILPPPSFIFFPSLSSFFLSVSLSLSVCITPWCGVGGWGATLSDSNCTDVNDILLMLSATSDTGARRGHSAAQTQGCSQTMYRNRSTVKSDCEREWRREEEEEEEGEEGEKYAETRGVGRLDY